MFITRLAGRAALAAAFLVAAACGGSESAEAESAAKPTATGGLERAGEGALGEMAIGSPDAPVTVIEYASVTCPHCATFHATIYPEIKKQYIETGKVRFIFREFPTAPANLSYAGSILARCAADKGGSDAYFVILGALFQNQRTWAFGEDPRAELIKIAGQAGMSESDFDACIQREEVLNVIEEIVDEGRTKYNVNSTPSFILDGAVRHFSTVEDFSKAIDSLLEKQAG